MLPAAVPLSSGSVQAAKSYYNPPAALTQLCVPLPHLTTLHSLQKLKPRTAEEQHMGVLGECWRVAC